MATTLSFGYKKPQTGDKGSEWFKYLEDDIQQLNDHNHDGLNSAPISTRNINAETQPLSSASWVSVSGGKYRQLVTVPNSKQFDNSIIIFRKDSAQKEQMYLEVEKETATTYYVYINDPDVSVIAYYVS